MAQSLEANKIIGAVLTAGILAVGSNVLAHMFYAPRHLETNAFHVDIAAIEGGSAAQPPAAAAPIADRLASADPEKGKAATKVCQSCHTFDDGAGNKVGPNLYNTVGEQIGQGKGGFLFSPALSQHGGTWTFENLDHFLTSPKEFAPGTKMSFAGLSKPDQRADVIAYLRSLSASPVDLPKAGGEAKEGGQGEASKP